MRYRRGMLALVLGAMLCAPSAARGEDAKALSRRLFEEVWNKGNQAAIGELIATSYVRHDPATPELTGIEGFKQNFTTLRTAFPDIHFTVEDQVAEGDKVANRLSWRGTHKGDYRGVAPTGKQV